MPLTLAQRMKLVQEVRAERCRQMLEEADRTLTVEIDAIVFRNKDSFLRDLQAEFRERQERIEREERLRLWKGVGYGLALSAALVLSIVAILRWG